MRKFINPSTVVVLLMIASTLFACKKESALTPRTTVPVIDSSLTDTTTTIHTDTTAVVTPCSRVWMMQNLDVVTFRNGDTIRQVIGDDAWGDMTILENPEPAWCYLYDDAGNGAVYGKLYNWAAIKDPRGLAPAGWHIATYTEWKELIDSCLGGAEVAGRALKQAGNQYWTDPGMANYQPTNSSGLGLLPGGLRAGIGFNNPIGTEGAWWCGTGNEEGKPFMLRLYASSNAAYFQRAGNDGVSVRCVHD